MTIDSGTSDPQHDPATSDLTEQQRLAVCHGPGPLLVVAGAGTGKTRVITRRIAHLVRAGTPPHRILAVTFTNKAADEMRRRVEIMVGADTTVTTFHSFCARLLRRDAKHLGLEPSFSIYDRADSLRTVRRIVRGMDLDAETYPPAKLLNTISVHKDRMETPKQVAEQALGTEEKTRAEIYRRYSAAIADSNAVDFDDLLVRTIELFNTHPAALQRLQDRYIHVLVDEYQDTNLPQHLIAHALQGKHRNITAVGDPDQMIYTWRGARLENILEFEQDFPGADVIILERNYRSTGHILHAASSCISHNRLRHDKALWTESESGEPVRVREFDYPAEEAEWIAEAAAELIEAGRPGREVAVLYRTKFQSQPLERAFSARTIPYQVVDTVAFYDRKQIKDLRAYLQLLANPRDDEAFRRIVNVPARGVGQTTLARLEASAAAQGLSLLAAAHKPGAVAGLAGRAKSALAKFSALYDELAAMPDNAVQPIIKQIVERTAYLNSVPAEERPDAREVIDVFLDEAAAYDERADAGGLTGFVEQVALKSDQDGINSQASAVPLMTLHAVKGLEFDVVFICGVEEGVLPHQRSLEENPYQDESYALEEERRLLHVGMTRARKLLHLTFARQRMVRGVYSDTGPSRFLDELPDEGIDRPASEESDTSASAFAGQAAHIIRRKRRPRGQAAALDDGTELVVGGKFQNEKYGEGTIVGLESAGKRCLVRVEFPRHGVLTILL